MQSPSPRNLSRAAVRSDRLGDVIAVRPDRSISPAPAAASGRSPRRPAAEIYSNVSTPREANAEVRPSSHRPKTESGPALRSHVPRETSSAASWHDHESLSHRHWCAIHTPPPPALARILLRQGALPPVDTRMTRRRQASRAHRPRALHEYVTPRALPSSRGTHAMRMPLVCHNHFRRSTSPSA